MKVEYKGQKMTKSMPVDKIKAGQIFSGNPPGYDHSVYLKTFDGVVDLVNPVKTWHDGPSAILNYARLSGELKVWPAEGEDE